MFAATFHASGPIDHPDVSINPLAALTPGVLRNLFDIFGSESKYSSNKKERGPPLQSTEDPFGAGSIPGEATSGKATEKE